MKINNLLSDLKSQLLLLSDVPMEKPEFSHLNYVINLIDWMILGKIDINEETVDQLAIELVDLDVYNPSVNVIYLIPQLKGLLNV